MTERRRLDFSDVTLYWVTPSTKDVKRLLERADLLLAAGVDAVQLRCEELTDRELVQFGQELKKKCRAANALFIVNNRADVALALDADGVHVGHEDLPVSFVRELMGHRRLVGVSTHSLPQALEAQRQGADYVSCGPLWATPTKPDYEAVGLGLIGLYKAAVKVPFVAIGGIDETNIDSVANAGARCVGVVRAFYDAQDPVSMVKNFKQKLQADRGGVLA